MPPSTPVNNPIINNDVENADERHTRRHRQMPRTRRSSNEPWHFSPPSQIIRPNCPKAVRKASQRHTHTHTHPKINFFRLLIRLEQLVDISRVKFPVECRGNVPSTSNLKKKWNITTKNRERENRRKRGKTGWKRREIERHQQVKGLFRTLRMSSPWIVLDALPHYTLQKCTVSFPPLLLLLILLILLPLL